MGRVPLRRGRERLVASPCSATLPGAPNGKIKAWHMLGDEKNGPSVHEIEAQIASSGKPISIAIAAGAGDWQGYNGGIYNGCTMGQTSTT